MSTTTINQLRQRIESLTEIPANEQCIGHFQMAVQTMLLDMLEHVQKLEKVMGIERA